MAETTYTLSEAERELTRRDCAQDLHAPWVNEVTAGSPHIVRMHCRCGEVTYVPEKRTVDGA